MSTIYFFVIADIFIVFLVSYYGDRIRRELKGRKTIKAFNDTIFSNRICNVLFEGDNSVTRKVVIKRKWADGRIEFISQHIVVQD